MTPQGNQEQGREEVAQEAGDTTARGRVDQPGAPETPSDPEELRKDIEQTREQLGDTVEALSEKADIKAQAKDRVEERKEALKEKQDEIKAKASALRGRVQEATPEDAKRVATQAAATAQEKPMPAIALAFVAGLLVGRLIKRS
ncbi:MAG: DUF3618 domain-containing protein [Thermoleophilaceae bacterium]